MSTQAEFRPRCSPVFPYLNRSNAGAPAKSRQLCPTLCDPIDGSPPGSPVPGILQARILEWVAISFSNAWKWKMKLLSHVRLLVTPWTAAYRAPPSMGFSRQEYWSGVPLPSPKQCYRDVNDITKCFHPLHVLIQTEFLLFHSSFPRVYLAQTKKDICKFQPNHYVISTSFLVLGENSFSLGRKNTTDVKIWHFFKEKSENNWKIWK